MRRFLKSLAKQDWGATLIELAIVVLGIFLGLQASSWYADQQELALEEELLTRLASDFAEIGTEGDAAIDAHQKIIEGLVVLQEALQEGGLREVDREAVLYSLSNVLNADTGAGHSPTYSEIIASGRLHILSDETLVSLLGEYDELVKNAQPLFNSFRLMQVEYEKDYHRYVEFAVPERFNSRGFSTANVTDFDFAAMQKDPEFQQALVRMTAFQTYFQIWHWRTFAASNRVLEQLAET